VGIKTSPLSRSLTYIIYIMLVNDFLKVKTKACNDAILGDLGKFPM